jgi:hypothetical protein
MGSLNVHTGGGWSTVNNLHVRPGGSWVPAKRVWTHTGSGWVLAWENEVTDTFQWSAGQTYQGSVLCSTTRCQVQLVVGEHPSNNLDHNGLWILGNGSVSGTNIGATLNGRSLVSLKVTLGLSWSYSGVFNGDGVPTRVALWGSTYSSLPGTFSGATTTYLGTLAWYPASTDYANGFAVVTQGMLGINPNSQGNRYPQVRADIDFTSQLSADARNRLTNGSIKSFVLRQYNSAFQKQNYTYYSAYTEPWAIYETLGIPAIGDGNAFRVKVTHTG